MKILVTTRVVGLCKRELGKTNRVYTQDHCLVVESTYAREEDLVCNAMVEFLYRHYYKKGMYSIPQDLIVELFGLEGFKLLRNNYAIEYAGTLHGKRVWMLQEEL